MKGLLDKFNRNSVSSNRGGGKALGGSKSGTIIDITITDHGPIGVHLENTSEGNAIVGKVIPGGSAERVNLQRGDIICYPNTRGNDEIKYKTFLEMIRSDHRPLQFEVRRLESTMPTPITDSLRADEYAKKQAIIAAAEARDKKNKMNRMPSKSGKELTLEQKNKIAEQREINARKNAEQMFKAPISDVSKKAVEAAKQEESKHAQKLGYNPYESVRATGQQGVVASIVSTHGTLSTHEIEDIHESKNKKESKKVNEYIANEQCPIAPEFDNAFSTLVLTNNHDEKLAKSLRIIRKLILNATTDGRTDEKKRMIRISNANTLIQEAILDMEGALDLMMCVGFDITENEDDSETYLVYPPGETDPSWLRAALDRLEDYEQTIIIIIKE